MNLPVREFSASGYRSLQRIAYPMSRLDVFVGANGVGKSNLYRGLELLRGAAANTLGHDLAREGLTQAMWAGARTRKPRTIRLAVGLGAPKSPEATYRYEVEIGYPPPAASPTFGGEPQIKSESLTYRGGTRDVRLLDRVGPSVMIRNEAGRPASVDIDILASETVLGRLEDPSRHPELDAVRRTLLEWRFYHDLRTDADSALRRPCVAVAAPTLVAPHPERTASFGMTFPEFPHRLFEAAELSDGTLRFLSLAGALMAYRLPPFIALNEPESSLHPDLMAPLARMVVRAAQRTQVWLVTHSERLADAIRETGEGAVRNVTKSDGATTIEGLTLLGQFRDED